LIPGVVILVGGAVIVALLRSAADEARLLHEELVRQREVGTSLRALETSLRGVGSPLRAVLPAQRAARARR
jgi:hypothetical protein